MAVEREIITVDGVSASGKSALARALAERLGFAHLNSGLLYRAAAFLVSQSGTGAVYDSEVSALLKSHTIELRYDRACGNQLFIDGILRDAEVTTQDISRLASSVAKLPSVRAHFVAIQQSAFAPSGVVAEGRDMGTVIFPNATTKFFIDADIGVRADRRRRQLAGNGNVVDVNTIKTELLERDLEDANRELSPMKPAQGAVIVDNSHETLEQVVERMYQAVEMGRSKEISRG